MAESSPVIELIPEIVLFLVFVAIIADALWD
jgi:hypothetical protein